MKFKKIVAGLLAVVTAVTAMTTIVTTANAEETTEIYLDNYTVKSIKNGEGFNFKDIKDGQYWGELNLNSDTVVSLTVSDRNHHHSFGVTIYTLENKTTATKKVLSYGRGEVREGVSFKLNKGSYAVMFSGAFFVDCAVNNTYTFTWKEKIADEVTTVKSLKVYIPLKKGTTIDLSTVVDNADAKILYSSSNKSIATVSSKGAVTAKKAGKVSISVKAGTKTVKLYFKIV